jgi:hypothetical protein
MRAESCETISVTFTSEAWRSFQQKAPLQLPGVQIKVNEFATSQQKIPRSLPL